MASGVGKKRVLSETGVMCLGGTKVEYAYYRAGYDLRGRVSVTHVVEKGLFGPAVEARHAVD